MGYGSVANFDLISGLGNRICELGDQTIYVETETAKELARFVAQYAAPPDFERFIGKSMHVRNAYERAGFEYVSIDINEQGGAKCVDLNFWPNESTALGQFDVVTNFGTTEHVGNQIAAFATIHHLMKPGGHAIHHIPILHYLNHALVNVTPRFLLNLIRLNDYSVNTAITETSWIDAAVAFHNGSDLQFMGAAEVVKNSTRAAMAFLVLRKNSDAPFVPPLDLPLSALKNYENIIQRAVEHYNPASAIDVKAVIERIIDRANASTPHCDSAEYRNKLVQTGLSTFVRGLIKSSRRILGKLYRKVKRLAQ